MFVCLHISSKYCHPDSGCSASFLPVASEAIKSAPACSTKTASCRVGVIHTLPVAYFLFIRPIIGIFIAWATALIFSYPSILTPTAPPLSASRAKFTIEFTLLKALPSSAWHDTIIPLFILISVVFLILFYFSFSSTFTLNVIDI